MKSPNLESSRNDCPKKYSLSLHEHLKIAAVSINAGAIVDSITLELTDGSKHIFGGSGGGAGQKVF